LALQGLNVVLVALDVRRLLGGKPG